MMTEKDRATKFLWIDLEMTGLNPGSQKIIEVAAVVTDVNLTPISEYQAVINQPDSVLEAAEEWPKMNMKQLFSEVKASEKSEEVVLAELSTFISDNFGEEPAVLAGNSIHQDRRFIRQWWPLVESQLHYRMLDVSSYKIWIQSVLGQDYEKQEAHRAMDDIKESIAELKWSLETLKQS